MAHQSSKKNERGALLLVGEHGEIKRVRHKKGVIKFLIFALLISMACCGGLYHLYQRAMEESALRGSELRILKDRALSLRDEKERLMARLVVLESERLDETAAPLKGAVEENGAEDGSGPAAEPPEGEENGEKTASQGGGAEAPATAAAPRIDADNFQIIWNKANGALGVRLKVVNANPASGAVSGYALASLKPADEEGDKRMLFPGGAWTTKQAIEAIRGYSFSISNFKIIRFKPKKLPRRPSFESAKVLIYTMDGALMFEKEFTIKPEQNGG
ncbi:MAG: hypothetical protein GY859_16605 [Desulfobacterales bacterium]|nr:hypothetical protein [Desulfobacterales bacterium]